MKHVGPTRVELGTRTIFNLLGPLSNPAGVKRQMVGVFSRQWVEPLAQVLKNLGSERVWVVHGSDGLDEITTSGPTTSPRWRTARSAPSRSRPRMSASSAPKPEALRGGDAEHNAAALTDVLEGKPRRRSATSRCSTPAAALVVAGKAKDLKDGVALAAEVDRLRRGAKAGSTGWSRSRTRERHDRHPEEDRSLQARGDRRRQARAAAAPRSRPRAKAAPPPRGFLGAIERQASQPATTR